MTDVLLLGERVHLRPRDLAQQGDLLGRAAERQPRLVAHAAEELLQAAMEQRAAFAGAELGIVAVVDLDVQQSFAEGPERAGRVVLELMRGERSFFPERERRPRMIKRCSRELA